MESESSLGLMFFVASAFNADGISPPINGGATNLHPLEKKGTGNLMEIDL
jgi:hypothetical protein